MAQLISGIDKARAQLVIKYPFISSILLATEIVEDDTLPFPGATNGDKIMINPKMMEEMFGSNLVDFSQFLLAHEVYHIAFLHPFRRGNRNAVAVDSTGRQVSVWNLACDGCVNEMLYIDGFKLPPECFRYEGAHEMSAEELYDKLLKDMKNNPKVQCISYDDCQDSEPGDGEGEGQSEGQGTTSKEMKAQIKVQRALDIAKSVGDVPASLQRLVGEAMESKIPWQQLLREWVVLVAKKSDYTWSKLNRRFLWNNQYMPGMYGFQCGPIAIFFDTSGSVGGEELGAFLGEMNTIMEEVHPELIMAGFCDCKFYPPHTELREEDLPMNTEDFSKITKGGGGTAFKPCFDYLKEQGIRPEMAIYFTDLCGSDFGDDPGYPVLWVSTHSTEAPFGQVIKLDL